MERPALNERAAAGRPVGVTALSPGGDDADVPSPFREVMRDAGRGVVGGLLLGMPLLYTMEVWWLAGRLDTWHLLGYAFGSLALVLATVHLVGFRPDHEGPGAWKVAVEDFAELLLHAFAAAFGILFLFGLVEWGDPVQIVARMGVMQILPIGFGAALANHALATRDETTREESLVREMATFAAGALFFTLPASPTEEMDLMAAHAGWWRLLLVCGASVVLCYLALYELRFRGEGGRERNPLWRWGETFAGYIVALVVCGLLLLGFGQFSGATVEEMVQKTVVLSFLGSLGGAAARVVL